MNEIRRFCLCSFLFIAVFVSAKPAWAIDEMRHPRLRKADQQLGDAIEILNGETRPESDYGGHRARAADLIRQAKLELDQAASTADSAQQDPAPVDTAAAGTYAEEPQYDAPPHSYTPPPEPAVYAAPPPPSSPVGFWGSHPIPGGGWCLAIGPHVHNYEPEFFDQFHLVEGYFRFGEGMQSWGYAGGHPIAGGGWCTIAIPHQHAYRPAVGFIYDPVRHGYYYDRERAVVVRTEIIRAPRNYRPPGEVIGRYNHPPALRRMPPGTPRPQPWAHERVIAHPAGHPMENHAVAGHPSATPASFHPAGGPAAAHPAQAAEHPAVRPGQPAAAKPAAAAAKPAAPAKPAAKPEPKKKGDK
jgi:hypothetical protein